MAATCGCLAAHWLEINPIPFTVASSRALPPPPRPRLLHLLLRRWIMMLVDMSMTRRRAAAARAAAQARMAARRLAPLRRPMLLLRPPIVASSGGGSGANRRRRLYSLRLTVFRAASAHLAVRLGASRFRRRAGRGGSAARLRQARQGVIVAAGSPEQLAGGAISGCACGALAPHSNVHRQRRELKRVAVRELHRAAP